MSVGHDRPLIQPGFERDDVEVLERETQYDGFFSIERLTLRHRLYEGGWSGRLQRELIIRRPAVGVLLFDPASREVVLIEQLRVGVLDDPDGGSPWLLELVAGLAEPGESARDVARREVREEAGCEVDALYPMPHYYSSPGGSNEHVTLFCGLLDASRAEGIHGRRDENEDIRVIRLTMDEVREALHSGRVHNAMALIAIQWLLLNETTLQKERSESSQTLSR